MKAKLYIGLQLFVVIMIIFAYIYLSDILVETINHNKLINTVVTSVFTATCLYVLIDTVCSIIKLKSLQGKVNERLIFGHRFVGILDSKNANSNELYTSWKSALGRKSSTMDFISGTLIGVGLLGTFLGLMHTMGSVFTVLSSSGSGKDLVTQLGVPLSGMSTAFSASMLGLSSSLIVGLQGNLMDKLDNEIILLVEKMKNGEDEESTLVINNTAATNRGLVNSIKAIGEKVECVEKAIICTDEKQKAQIDESKRSQQILTNIYSAINQLGVIGNKNHQATMKIYDAMVFVNGHMEVTKSTIESMMKKNSMDINELKEKLLAVTGSIDNTNRRIEECDRTLNKLNSVQTISSDLTTICLQEVVATRTLIENSVCKVNDDE